MLASAGDDENVYKVSATTTINDDILARILNLITVWVMEIE